MIFVLTIIVVALFLGASCSSSNIRLPDITLQQPQRKAFDDDKAGRGSSFSSEKSSSKEQEKREVLKASLTASAESKQKFEELESIVESVKSLVPIANKPASNDHVIVYEEKIEVPEVDDGVVSVDRREIVVEEGESLSNVVKREFYGYVFVFDPVDIGKVIFPQRVVVSSLEEFLNIVRDLFSVFIEVKGRTIFVKDTGLRVYDVGLIVDKVSPQVIESLLSSEKAQVVLNKESGQLFVFDNAEGQESVRRYLESLYQKFDRLYEYSIVVTKKQKRGEDKVIYKSSGQIIPDKLQSESVKLYPLSNDMLKVKVHIPKKTKWGGGEEISFEAVVGDAGGIITNKSESSVVKLVVKRVSL